MIHLSRLFQNLKKFAGNTWFPILVALLAGLDAFVLVVPIEPLMIPAILAHRKRWFLIPVWISIGSALGAIALAEFIRLYGTPFVHHWMPDLMNSDTWTQAQE